MRLRGLGAGGSGRPIDTPVLCMSTRDMIGVRADNSGKWNFVIVWSARLMRIRLCGMANLWRYVHEGDMARCCGWLYGDIFRDGLVWERSGKLFLLSFNFINIRVCKVSFV